MSLYKLVRAFNPEAGKLYIKKKFPSACFVAGDRDCYCVYTDENKIICLGSGWTMEEAIESSVYMAKKIKKGKLPDELRIDQVMHDARELAPIEKNTTRVYPGKENLFLLRKEDKVAIGIGYPKENRVLTGYHLNAITAWEEAIKILKDVK